MRQIYSPSFGWTICAAVLASALFVTALLSSTSVLAQNAWGDSPYGAYSFFPQGSDRAMALGGASVALIDDASAIVFNPAGAAIGPTGPAKNQWRANIGTTNNSIDHQELGYNFPDTYGTYETKYDSPYSYFFYAGAVRLGSWVIGAAYSSPYFYEFKDINSLSRREISRFEVKLRSIDYMVAYQISPDLSVGFAGHNETLREFYNNTSLPAPIPAGFESTASNQYFSGGVMFRHGWYGIGASYSQRREFKVDTSANTILSTYNTTPFRDVVIPARTTVGIFVRPIDRLMVSVDSEFIERLDKQAVYVSAATTSTELLKQEAVTLLRGGVEADVIKDKDYDLTLRAGGYNEPTRFENGRARLHYTYGATLRLWLVVLSYGADQAEKFSNSAYSASVKLDDF